MRDSAVAAAVMVDGVGDIGQRHGGAVTLQPVGQRTGRGREALSSLARDDERRHRRTRILGRHWRGIRSLFQHDMGVGAAHAERRHGRATRTLAVRATVQTSVGTNSRVDDGSIAGFHCAKLRFGGMCAVPQRQHGLDEPGDAGGRLQVAEVRLHRAQCARRLALAVHGGQGVELDRITQSGSGAVGFDEVHRCRPSTSAERSARVMTSRCDGAFGAVRPLERPS